MKVKDLEQLGDLTQAQLQAAQSSMAALARQETKLRDQLDGLVSARNASVHEPRQAGDAALRAGADVRWHRWIDSRRASLNAELALILAKREQQTETVRRAFGRNAAVEALTKNERAARKMQAARKIAYD